MAAVIGLAVWLVFTLGGMTALGLWLERDYQRGKGERCEVCGEVLED